MSANKQVLPKQDYVQITNWKWHTMNLLV